MYNTTASISGSAAKRLMIRALIISLFVMLTAAAAAVDTHAASAKNATGRIDSRGGAILRAKTSVNSKKVGKLRNNRKITIHKEIFTKKNKTSKKTRWYYVTAGKKKGYVRADLVDSLDYSHVKGRTVAYLNYRVGPGVKMKKVGLFNYGAQLDVVLKAKLKGSKMNWYKVKAGKKYVYVCADYVAFPVKKSSGGSMKKVKMPSCLEDSKYGSHRVSSEDWGTDGTRTTAECIDCGKSVEVYRFKKTGVKFIAKASTRIKTVGADVTNNKGFTYHYKIYWQAGGFKTYSRYMHLHGCSTAALTTVLNATVPTLKDYPPNKIISEVEYDVLGHKAFYKNYKKDGKNGDMPITLLGMTKILDAYGVKYKLPASNKSECVKEITEHLKNGDPVIMTFNNGSSGGLSSSIHTIVLIGLDKNNHPIIADSVFKDSSVWGDDGLVKTGRLSVSKMVSYIGCYGNWSVCRDNYTGAGADFYDTKADRGYLLIYGK
ncbi:MAG: hypothetical protein E7220_01090 [Clostridiales bacterium]|nr:hypothetical protein [Clostridiales bacterium]